MTSYNSIGASEEGHTKLSTTKHAIARFIRKTATAAVATLHSQSADGTTAATSLAAAAALNDSSNDYMNNDIDIAGNNRSNGTNSSNNLSTTIISIRRNVTRVLFMYFQNASDEYGYGYGGYGAAQTTEQSIETVSAVATPTAVMPANILTATHGALQALSTTATRGLTSNVVNRATYVVNAATIAAAATTQAAIGQQVAAKSAASATATALMAATAATTAAKAAKAAGVGAIINVTAAITTEIAGIGSDSNIPATAPSITYPSNRASIKSYENCSALFANYTQPHPGIFCNWTWDTILCWPPTPAGVLARMHCPSGFHGIDTRKFAHRKCELHGHWGGRPNETETNSVGWTDYQPCFKPEVTKLMQQIKHFDLYMEIAKRTRTLEIVGLILSLLALIISLIIFCNFRSLRNNRTKIHKNLFIAMVLQVIVRLTLYLDQAFRRGKQPAATNSSLPGIENTPYLCEASYVLLEYARTAMFMWMFIEGLYLHNMVTVAVFQGRFPHTIFSLCGWGMPVVMTTVWAICTAANMDTSQSDCWWNYNLTPYYWILEGPRLVVIMLNFFFLVNIIRVLVVKLRQSQASDIEQTRKAVRAAIVLLPLLGITNLLHLLPDLKTPWKFALWSYVTHFLTSFQGFFIALIYCFLNGEVRAVLLKSIAVYMSLRGHSEWVPKRASMYSGAYNTAPDTDALQQPDVKRVSPPNRRCNYRKGSNASIVITQISVRDSHRQRSRLKRQASLPQSLQPSQRQQVELQHEAEFEPEQHLIKTTNNNNASVMPAAGDVTNCNEPSSSLAAANRIQSKYASRGNASGVDHGMERASSNWMLTLCFRGQKNKCVMPAGSKMTQRIFMTPQIKSTANATTTETTTKTNLKKTTLTTTTKQLLT